MVTGQQYMTPKLINKEINETVYNELSIQVSFDGLSFCILNTTSNTISHFAYFPFTEVGTPYQLLEKVKRVFANSLILHNSFSKVKLVFVNNLSTLVPKSLFNDQHLADYMKFNTKVLENDYITYDVISNNEMVNVYVPYANINNFIFEEYGSFEYKHHTSILIENVLANAQNSEEPSMYVHMQETHFEILVIKSRKLIFYNSFSFSNEADYIYYILFTAEQLHLNPDIFKLYFLGNVSEGDPIYNITYKYVRNVLFEKRNRSFKFDGNLAPENLHSDYILLNSL
jgi:hypothetical protein